jgi:hypothetical protein
MQIVHANELPMQDGQSGARAGTWKTRRVMEGDPRSPGNFSLIIYYQNGSFFSPRHHHNFDQFRFQIEGTADFGRNGKMTPGVMGYFPEGAYYGPQSGPPHVVATLQFGGPSGLGYLAAAEHMAGAAALKATGVFEGGVYRRHPEAEGKRSQDAYEAIWEQARSKRLVYPKPQYAAPIMIDSNNFPWSLRKGVAGVEEKVLGTFTNCKISAARYRLKPGATFVAAGRGVYMVLAGKGFVEREALQELTTLYLDDGEEATFKADAQTEMVFMGMSSVEQTATQVSAPSQQLAAE